MPLRIVTLGRVPPDLDQRLREASVELLEAVPVLSMREAAASLRALDPDLVVVGENAPWGCRELAEAGRDPRLLVPLLSTSGDPYADFDLVRDGREPEGVLRAALRLARLHRLARSTSLPALGAESSQGLRRLSAEFTRALRYRHALGVVVLAMDRAPDFRETYGPEAVEGFAAAVTQSLSDTLRAADFLFRAGELEWVIGLPETPAAGAQVVAQRLRTRTRTLVHKAPAEEGRPALPLKATASVGVADGPSNLVGSAADLLARARDAMESARRAGGDRVVFAGVASDPAQA